MRSKFAVTTYPYSKQNFRSWVLQNDYHCVYILENGRHAYVGETLKARKRAAQHVNKYKRYGFQRMHIITSKLMEATPAEHYERLLIKLMKTDRLFEVINRNEGNETHYMRCNLFELHFDKLWIQLSNLGLTKRKDFKFILNSGTFKYSPYTDLTLSQKDVLNHIVHTLLTNETQGYDQNYKNRPIWINGSAGTGKTLIATSLFHFLRNDPRFQGKKIALVVANMQMRHILKRVFIETGEGLKGKDVIKPIELTRQRFDIVICDEVHALRRNKNLWLYSKQFIEGNKRLGLSQACDELDWILTQSDRQVLFYDKKQCVKHSDIRDASIKEKITHDPFRGVRPIELTEQMRIEAGNSYIPYIFAMLKQQTKHKKTFQNYRFELFESFSAMCEEIRKKEEECGLSRLCSNYAWEWSSKTDRTRNDIEIEGVKIKWNSDSDNWIGNETLKFEMGSMYTLRGIDLNYAGVVIGPDLYFDEELHEIKVDKASLYSNDVKKGATEEEIKGYVLNIYALLLTRAIKGTFVYVCDKPLRDYFRSYIESV